MARENEKLGSDLLPMEQDILKEGYPNRYTQERKPPWATEPRRDGTRYMPQFVDDDDWLAHTWFQVDDEGRLDVECHSCYSMPTWPEGRHEHDNQALSKEMVQPLADLLDQFNGVYDRVVLDYKPGDRLIFLVDGSKRGMAQAIISQKAVTSGQVTADLLLRALKEATIPAKKMELK